MRIHGARNFLFAEDVQDRIRRAIREVGERVRLAARKLVMRMKRRQLKDAGRVCTLEERLRLGGRIEKLLEIFERARKYDERRRSLPRLNVEQ